MSVLDPARSATLRAALAAGPQPYIAELAKLFTALPGVTTMTILATAPDRSIVHRIGTSDAAGFPLGGFDPIDDGPWSRRIFVERLPVIGNTSAEMARYIPETAELEAAGFGSTICVPVIVAGEVRGTVNLLGAAGVFTPDVLAAVDALLPLAALVFAFEGISAP